MFFFVLCYALLGLYESVAIIGAPILLYALASWKKRGAMPICPVCYSLGCLLLLANVLQEGYYIYNPMSQELKDGFIYQLVHQPRAILILLTLFAVFLLGMELGKAKKGGAFEKLLRAGELLLAVIYFLYVVLDPGRVARQCMDARTLLNVALPMAFILFEIVLLYVPNRRTGDICLLTAVMGVVFLLSVIGTGTGYYQYLKGLSAMTMNSRGFVGVTWNKEDPGDSYAIGWTIPYESVASSALFSPGEPIQSIVVQRKDTIWFQHFNQWDIDQYPNLSAYGIQYDKAAFDPTVNLSFQPGELAYINCGGEEWNVDTFIDTGLSHNEISFTWTDGNTLLFRPIQIAQYDGSPLYLKLYVDHAYHVPQRLIAYCGEERVFETVVELEGGRR